MRGETVKIASGLLRVKQSKRLRAT
jgi:hypothetical protein